MKIQGLQGMASFKKKILILSTVHKNLVKNLKKKKLYFKYCPNPNKRRLHFEIKDAYIIILRSGIKIDQNLIFKSKNLKYIIRAGSGLDNIDIKTAKKRNIKVFSLPNLNSQSVAELGFGLLISASRNIIKADRELKKNLWNKPNLYGYELKNKTIGIIGLGNIGIKVAKIAKNFSMNVLAYVKNKSKKRNVNTKTVSLVQLFKKSDFIIFNVPLNKGTANLLNKKNSKFLRPNAVIVNLSRGGVINENTLYSLLKKRKIFAAASDVFLNEGKKNKLFKLDNMISTPHIGAMSYDAQKLIAKKTFDKICRLLK